MPRLVDADELIERIEACYCKPCREKGVDYHGIRRRACETDDAKCVIEDALTVDAEPVRHGKWALASQTEIHDGEETKIEEKCSECGRRVERYDTRPMDNYCPSCGAKMDAEEKMDNNE